MLFRSTAALLQPPSAPGVNPFTYRWHTLSRSYGVNLPSSLTWVISNALVFSTCPPESVCGTVTSRSTQLAAFLGSMGSITSTRRSRHHLSMLHPRFIPMDAIYRLAPGLPAPGQSTLLRPCSAPGWWYGNINPLSIDFAVQLRLRTD